MNDRKPAKLIPARPDAVADGDYGRHFPWRWLILGASILTAVVVGHTSKEQGKADRLRRDILHVHRQELGEAATRYMEFRDKLAAWIVEAAKEEPKTFVDKRLKLSGLRSGNGLYLRLPVEIARERKYIANGALRMGPDAITRCLGLAPASARGLYQKGYFLLPEWMDDVHDNDSVMSLRVKDEMLARHIKGDLTGVLGLLRSDWFLLVLEHPPSRAKAPVDVFLWDIRSGQQLLAGRVKASGLLLPARILSKGMPAAPKLPESRLHGGAAIDCSIAAKIRELVGFPPLQVHSITANSFRAPDAGVAPTP